MASSLPSTLNDELASTYGLDSFPGIDFGKGIRERTRLTVPQPSVSDVSHLPGDTVAAMNSAASADQTLLSALAIATRADDVGDMVPQEILTQPQAPLNLAFAEESPQLSADLVGNPESPLEIDLSNESTAFEIQASDVGLRDGQKIIHQEWMEAVQDPSRLPSNSSRNSMAELESLWGEITTGKELRPEVLQDLLRVAMRRSAQGENLQTIRKKLESLTQSSWPRVQKAFSSIEAEHGLHGFVYVRASAFPGLHRGKHASVLRKLAGRARYLVGGNKEAAAALGLKFIPHVREIPWDQMFKLYQPKLAAEGRKVLATNSPREALRSAFLNKAEVRAQPGFFPQGRAQAFKAPKVAPIAPKDPRVKKWERMGALADRMVRAGLLTFEKVEALRKSSSPEDFRKALVEAAAKPKRPNKFQGTVVTAAPVLSHEAHGAPVEVLVQAKVQQKARQRVEDLVQKLKRQGVLTPEQATSLAKMSSVEEVRAAVRKQERVPFQNYSGGYRHHDPLKRQAAFELQKQREEQARTQAQEQALVHAQIRTKVARIRKAAERGEDIWALVPRIFTEIERRAAARAIAVIASQAREAAKPQIHEGEYQGKVYTAHQSGGRSDYDNHTLASAQRWILQQLHRGEASFLNQELQRRYASVAQHPSLVQIRTKHQGKAGKIYIDASAFASPTGVSGCEKAAQILQRSPARFVIAMDRCQGCMHRNVHGDCQKYRRSIVSSESDIPKEV